MDGDENLNLNDDDVSNNDTDNLDPHEAEALEKGWKPQDEWEGDPKDWRDARTFLDRESFFKKIKSQNREIHELKQSLHELGKLQVNIAKLEREKVLKELASQRRDAVQEQDLDRVDQLNDQIAEIKAAPLPSAPAPVTANNQDLEDFLERNPWFNQDQDLREMAEGIALKYVTVKQQSGEPIVPIDVYSHIESKMAKVIKKETPKVADPVSRQNTVVSRNPIPKDEKKYTVRDLKDYQKQVGRRFVEQGVYKDIQAYVDDLVRTGGL